MPDTQIYDLDGLPRTSIPRRRRALVGIGVLETLSLVVLLGDLASGNERLIAQAVGPLHGPMYLTGIVLIFTTERSPQPTACRDPKYRKFFSPSRRRTPRPTPADVNNRPAQPNAGALAANDRKLAFTAATTFCAYGGLRSWKWIAVPGSAHMLGHRHALRGANILPFVPHSSTGCAICDPVIAIWFFAGGPSVPASFIARFNRLTHRSGRRHRQPFLKPGDFS